jgi:hypothetical protein
MVDYSQFVFHERDHSYGYAEEVSVASGSDYCPRIEHRQLYHHYQIKPVVGSMLEACQDMPLNLSLNSPQSSLWESMPVTSAVAVTSPAYSDEADIDQPGEGAGGESPELGSLFIVSDLGAHIAQEEIVESEIVEEEETEQEEEESTTDEEDEGVQQVYSHELSKNSRLRSKVNDLTKASIGSIHTVRYWYRV